MKITGIVCILIRDKKILVMKRNNYPKTWCYVVGRLEDYDKSPTAGIIREIQEETELVYSDDYTLYKTELFENFYVERKNKMWLAPVFVAVLSSEKEVKLNFEHSDYKWLGVKEALDTFEFDCQKEIVEKLKIIFLDNEPNRSLIV